MSDRPTNMRIGVAPATVATTPQIHHAALAAIRRSIGINLAILLANRPPENRGCRTPPGCRLTSKSTGEHGGQLTVLWSSLEGRALRRAWVLEP
jgi:hypothetical protein